MGNFNTSKYQLNNSSMSKKSHSFFNNFGCNISGKKNKKAKSNEHFKSKSMSFDENESDKMHTSVITHQKIVSQDKAVENTEATHNCPVNISAPFNNLNEKNNKSIINETNNSSLHLNGHSQFHSHSKILENSNKENSINYKSDYSESYKSYLCRKNRYISSPRTCVEHFNLSNYFLKWSVMEKDIKLENGRIVNEQVCVSKSIACDTGKEYALNGQIVQSYPRLSECSLNSDDLMLSTDVNLDQADDDVSKDYNTSEKDDPFIYENNIKKVSVKVVNESKSILSSSTDPIADELERNDIVSFDSSRESSVSTQRKSFGKGFSLRPHSFSSPLRPNARESKPFGKRNSNLSTVESVDLAWTWISTSETANLSQDISNLKLMLLKMKRLLLDETLCDGFLSSSRIDTSFNIPGVSSVFSEPNTPNCTNTILNPTQIDHELPQNKHWDVMTKEMLIQELHEMHQQNGELQYQLKEKSRIIEFLQDQQQNYRNYPRRLHSTSSKGELPNRRIIRSSTFETASTLNNKAFNEDADFSFSGTQDAKIIHSESIHS